MKLSRPLLETDIAQSVRTYLEAQGLTVRSEVPVVLPDHGLVTADLIARKADDMGDWFTVVECKRKLNAELESQVMRWLPFAHYVCAAWMPGKSIRVDAVSRAGRLDRAGVGRWFPSNHGVVRLTYPVLQNPLSISLISAAFYAHDGTLDPPAGSPAARRQTPARTQWEPASIYLKGIAPLSTIWKQLQRDVPEMEPYTCAQAVKAIKRGEWIGPKVDEKVSPCEFRWEHK